MLVYGPNSLHPSCISWKHGRTLWGYRRLLRGSGMVLIGSYFVVHTRYGCPIALVPCTPRSVRGFMARHIALVSSARKTKLLFEYVLMRLGLLAAFQPYFLLVAYRD